jgi:hypothetical protein
VKHIAPSSDITFSFSAFMARLRMVTAACSCRRPLRERTTIHALLLVPLSTLPGRGADLVRVGFGLFDGFRYSHTQRPLSSIVICKHSRSPSAAPPDRPTPCMVGRTLSPAPCLFTKRQVVQSCSGGLGGSLSHFMLPRLPHESVPQTKT